MSANRAACPSSFRECSAEQLRIWRAAVRAERKRLQREVAQLTRTEGRLKAELVRRGRSRE